MFRVEEMRVDATIVGGIWREQSISIIWNCFNCLSRKKKHLLEHYDARERAVNCVNSHCLCCVCWYDDLNSRRLDFFSSMHFMQMRHNWSCTTRLWLRFQFSHTSRCMHQFKHFHICVYEHNNSNEFRCVRFKSLFNCSIGCGPEITSLASFYAKSLAVV